LEDQQSWLTRCIYLRRKITDDLVTLQTVACQIMILIGSIY